jgi:AcrR family transcriptional regulator
MGILSGRHRASPASIPARWAEPMTPPSKSSRIAQKDPRQPQSGDHRTEVAAAIGVRRPARQQRSQDTLERILEAAGRSFDEAGVDASTMDAIAERAGTSIGSVYRFFKDKDAVVATVMQRWRERAADVFVDLYSDERLTSDAEEVLGEFITRFARLVAETPGARGLLAAAITAPGTLPDQSWTPYVERFIARYAPVLPAGRRRAAAQTYQTITFALMVDAARAGRSMGKRLVEARSVLTGYIRQLAAEP